MAGDVGPFDAVGLFDDGEAVGAGTGAVQPARPSTRMAARKGLPTRLITTC